MVILNLLFDWIFESFSITDNSLATYLLMAVTGLNSFLLSKRLLNAFYSDGYLNGKKISSLVYWSYRLGISLSLFFAFAIFINVIMFVVSIFA